MVQEGSAGRDPASLERLELEAVGSDRYGCLRIAAVLWAGRSGELDVAGPHGSELPESMADLSTSYTQRREN
jgi:hypothetical protein